MIVSAHQPSYIPWLGFFHKVSLCDVFVYYDHVQHSKKDFTTRNKIKTSQGPMWLTVPVQKGETDRILDLQIDNQTPWQRRHLKSIYSCYGKAEYFKNYIGPLEDFFHRKDTLFAEMNFELTKILLHLLGLDVSLVRSSDLNITLQKNEGIYQMMEALGAKKLVFGRHGHDYADVSEYQKRGYQCYFQDYIHPVYKQMYEGFEPYMSVLDLIFNCGPNSLTILQSNNIFKSELFNSSFNNLQKE